ncbi:MAG: hypothetical protein AAB583_00095 [Patescibacteria group bacterium]|mgnify:FL=1
MIKKLGFWLENKNTKKFASDELNFEENKLIKATMLLEKNKMEIIYVDITHKTMRENGFWVIKAIIPQLCYTSSELSL